MANPMETMKKSGIHINPANVGTFTKTAKAAGETVQQHAHKVVGNPQASEKQRKRAQFAINMKAIANKHKK